MALSKNIQTKLAAIIEQYSNGDTITLTADQLVAAFAPKPKPTAIKRRRDPTKPKAPMSAFKRWKLNESVDIAAGIESETGVKMSKRELNKRLAYIWEDMTENDKSAYTIVAGVEQTDYKGQLKAWKARTTGVPKNLVTSSPHPKAVKHWVGPLDGFIEGSPTDPTSGKKLIKGFATIDEAIAKADELGANGITKVGTRFRVRTGVVVSCNEESRAKGEYSWIRN